MITCAEFRSLWTEWRGEDLSELESMRLHTHIEVCAACRRYDQQMAALLNALHTLPKPPVLNKESSARLLANAKTAASRSQRPFAKPLALAASLAIAFIAGAVFWASISPPPNAADTRFVSIEPIALDLNKIHTVRLVLDAKRDIDVVTFIVELPEGVELAGYPGERRLSWEGSLSTGRNGLTLPVVARMTEFSGTTAELVTQIEYNGSRQALRVPLNLPVNHDRHVSAISLESAIPHQTGLRTAG